MHYYQFNIGDYRRDTQHLSRLEHSIYRDLIDWYYLEESPIPKETQVVMRRLRLETDEETNALENVLSDFFTLTDGWHNSHIDRDISEYRATCEKNRANGRQGGRPKKTQSVILANQNESQNNPNQEPRTNNQEPIKEKPLPASRAVIFQEKVSDQVKADFLAIRKAKKAPLTQTAIDGIHAEAKKAGYSLQAALEVCCASGWQGFKASWVKDLPSPKNETGSEMSIKDHQLAFARRQAGIGS